MAGGMRNRPALPPTGHPADDEFRVARPKHVRTEAQPLQHARAEAFDHDVGLFAEFKRRFDAVRIFQIQRDIGPAARQIVELLIDGAFLPDVRGAINAQDVRAHVRQQHAAMGSWPNAGELNNLHTLKRSHILPFPWRGRRSGARLSRLPPDWKRL
jgi:hypothetical protein